MRKGSIKKTSDRVLVLKEKGNQLFLKKRYAEAIPFYNQCIQLDPNFEIAWLNKALCLMQLDNSLGAFDCLNTAIKLNAMYAKAVYHKAKLLMSLGLTDLALQTLDRYIANEGSSPDVLNYRKECAEKRVTELLGENAPKTRRQLLRKRRQHKQKGKLPEANAYFEAAMALAPGKDVVAELMALAPSPASVISQSLWGSSDKDERLMVDRAIAIRSTNKKYYLRVHQGCISRWEYSPAYPNSFQYGLYTDGFFNCVVIALQSKDGKRISLIHADGSVSREDIGAELIWVGEDANRVIYFKEHEESRETLGNLFAGAPQMQSYFEFKPIAAQRNARGQIIPDYTVAPVNGQPVPEYDADLVRLDQFTCTESKYLDDQMLSDDKVCAVIYSQHQPKEQKDYRNKQGADYLELLGLSTQVCKFP